MDERKWAEIGERSRRYLTTLSAAENRQAADLIRAVMPRLTPDQRRVANAMARRFDLRATELQSSGRT